MCHVRETLPENEFEDAVWSGFERLEKGEPLAYLIGWVPFGDLKIKCDRRALAPRIETEQLLEIFEERAQPKEGDVLVDLCCGTGAIGLALKNKFNGLEVILSDISVDALELARENAQGMDAQLVQGDMVIDQRARYVVCNPPYLSEKEHSEGYEPELALVGGESGTECYVRLKKILPKGCEVFLEIGHSQGPFIKDLFEAEIISDTFGLDRFAYFKNLV